MNDFELGQALIGHMLSLLCTSIPKYKPLDTFSLIIVHHNPTKQILKCFVALGSFLHFDTLYALGSLILLPPYLFSPSNAEATFVQSTIMMQRFLKTIETLSCCYSLESSRSVLSDKYPCATVSVIFQVFCIIFYWPK